MTERLYYTSDATEGQANITRCMAEPDGRYAIILDRTLFHPQGGGQPADSGWIGKARVQSVISRGEEVVHIADAPLPLDEATMRVDADIRQLHARMHSAGHLIGMAGEQSGWRPVKAHHWPGEGRITFSAGTVLPEACALLEMVELWQAENLPRQISFTNGLRNVGFGDMSGYPCGGTHVAMLSELGKVNILQVKMKKGQMTVSYTLE